MSKQVLFRLLDRANNGNQLLEVIDSFAAEFQSESQDVNATMEEIQFWCSFGVLRLYSAPLIVVRAVIRDQQYVADGGYNVGRRNRVLKKLNNPNLQRWQSERVISISKKNSRRKNEKKTPLLELLEGCTCWMVDKVSEDVLLCGFHNSWVSDSDDI